MASIKKIKRCIKWFIPYGIVIHREEKKDERLSRKQNEIRNYFLSLNTNDPEILEIIGYFKKYKFSVFPYEFSRKYHASDIDVFFDKTAKMKYVLHNMINTKKKNSV